MKEFGETKIITIITICIMLISIGLSGCIEEKQDKNSKPDGDTIIEPYSNPMLMDRSLVVNDIDNSKHYDPNCTDCCKGDYYRLNKDRTEFNEFLSLDIGNSKAPLYFVFGIHTCDTPIINDKQKFINGSIGLKKIQKIFSEFGAKMTVQVSRKFADWLIELNDDSLLTVTKSGSEIALHIHEDWLLPEYLGLPYKGVASAQTLALEQTDEVWLGAFEKLINDVKNISGVNEITGFSGAPWCENRFKLMAGLGLSETYSYKDPNTRGSVSELLVLNPWRPAGSASTEEIIKYDRNGSLIFIPSGVMPLHCKESEGIATPFCHASFDYVTTMIRESLKEVDENKINVFSITFHCWDFEVEDDYKLWHDWLATVIKPLVDDGRIKFATFHEIGEMYESWEENLNLV